jgi:hypothetical protein
MTNTRTLLGGVALVAATAAITSAVTTQVDPDTALAYTKPSAHHDVLDKLWGKWHYKIDLVSDDGEDETLAMDADYRWTMGGRFLIGNYEGYFGGESFLAKDILGHDNFRGEYESLWVDNNSTAFTLSTGTYDARKKTLTFKGVQDDVERNLRDQPFTFIYRFVDEDRFEIAISRPGPDGKLVTGTKVTATRR